MLLTGSELRPLTQPSFIHSWMAVIGDWCLIILTFALAIAFPHPVVWTLCFVMNARHQLALAILMHDGSHRRLFKSFAANDFVSQFLCAAPLFFSMYSYQRLHLKHHRAPLAPDDPDLSLTGGYPVSRGSLARKLLRDASGLSYIKFIRYFVYMARKPKTLDKPARIEKDAGPRELKMQGGGGKISLPLILISIVLANLSIWLPLFLVGHGWLYLFLWVIPAVTALQVLLRIRGIAEHAGYQANEDQRMNARTVLNPLQTFLFAPHNVNYHIEHHVYPAVPFHNLPKLHRILREKNLLPEANVYRGYGKILRELTRRN